MIADMSPNSIRDTIFSRQPLFFSLCVILDSEKDRIKPENIARSLHRIDEIFNADIDLAERMKDEADFIAACSASTQRIKSRQIRHNFIVKHI